ncbi:golgin subfamily A member 6-like protein 22 [Canna indica]|uniref:Golgin subfamily A member 6-like protein 22 n=1 Tax=Canna indica TaxID=4628 RepID=A0AAQ3PYY7_9LILI|nr:golgin subfamily A member 6-like protein 22 [Canna indica]
MGGGISMCHANAINSKSHHESNDEELRAKILALEEEIKELKRAREHEDEAQAFKQHLEEEEEEKRRKKVNDVIAMNNDRRRWTEEEERLRWLAAEAAIGSEFNMQLQHEWCNWSSDDLVEQMMEEQAQRHEAVEKWKQLYLAIKAELDQLIHKTQRAGGRIDWKAEELMIEWHEKELKAQEEMMETLKSRIAVMEKEEAKRDREIDILRQSLRILDNPNRKTLPKCLCALITRRE